MIAKNDVLNRISNFNCTIDVEKIKFPGILQEVNGNIVLNAMVSVDQYQKMLSNADFNILGSIFRSVYKELHADHETGAADNK